MVSREAVAQKVRASMVVSDLTPQVLARELGISDSDLQDKLDCLIPFTIDELVVIARFSGIGLPELFAGPIKKDSESSHGFDKDD